jgi:predicted aspartyl protease/tetratricopeptide (TPR) repeat protein
VASRWRALVSVSVALLACAGSEPAHAASGGCQLGQLLDLPIMMEGFRPRVTVQMNGTDVPVIVDSGAFYSMISPGSAAQLKLPTSAVPGMDLYVSGVGGKSRTQAQVATVKAFSVSGHTLKNVEFLVAGNELGGDSMGLLGRNFLSLADTEYDLSHGEVRLFVPKDCRETVLAYWSKPPETYSVIELGRPEEQTDLGSRLPSQQARWRSPITAVAYINGVAVHVAFDTGASTSTLFRRAAERVGIKLDSASATYMGVIWGVGRSTVDVYAAPIQSFKIGDEEIKNTRLYVADGSLEGTDMLLGADFFLSHHVFVAQSQHKIYFTYNGGPVFKFQGTQRATPISAATAPAASEAPTQNAPTAADVASTEAPASTSSPANATAVEDAGEHARRGEALESRHAYEEALVELTAACKLAPDNAQYLYQRARLYAVMGRRDVALSDLNQALSLKPNEPFFLIARAGLNERTGDRSKIGADLDAAAAAAAKEADVRRVLADAYERADMLGPALAQYDLWITAHPTDVRLTGALASRCRVRALQGTELAAALKDCDAAVKHGVKGTSSYAQMLSTRGLVRLRSGEYRKSEEDYAAALAIEPQDAWSLYGRGIDELRDQHAAEGKADMDKAAAIWPQVAQEFAARGVSTP